MDTHIKADSSKRGGSMKARGYEQSSNDSSSSSNVGRDSDLSQGGFDAVIIERGSSLNDEQAAVANDPNYNPSDDLLPDNQSNSSKSGVGASAEASIGSGSSKDESLQTSKSNLDDIDIQSTSDDSRAKQLDQSALNDQGTVQKNGQLNTSGNLEQNISGNFANRSEDPNARDTFESSVSSSRSTDINHDGSEATTTVGVGTAATSESGSSSSSTHYGAMPQSDRVISQSPNWLMQDNRALGVGSAATGEQGAAVSTEAGTMSNDQLAQRVKAELTKESTGAIGMMRSEVARNITVTSNNGVIVLKGTVPSQQDKDIIGIRAREVRGVNRVDNQLRVNAQSNPDNRDLSKGHDLQENLNEVTP
jgi:osmotically-inducible protein OsmY